ncbi:MAG TPA: SRPBCC family protein [Acidimicrobiales bacterium]|nr:SRPBCC family protein [Acidimicrobiales bacterium]
MPGSPYVIDYRGSFDFPLPPDQVWDVLEHSERFETWWGWLHEFQRDGGGLEEGSVLRGVVSPPVPYEMRIRVVLDHCRRPHRIDAHVEGDLEGSADLLLEPRGDGTRAAVSWTVEMKQRSMRIAARLAPPLMRFGHDRVVEMTVSSFRRHLGRAVDPPRGRPVGGGG